MRRSSTVVFFFLNNGNLISLDTDLNHIFIVFEYRNDPVKLDKTFIPPVLDCTVSGEIKGYIEEVSGLLRQRGEALSHRLSDSGRSGSAEIADYLLLQVINRVQTSGHNRHLS